MTPELSGIANDLLNVAREQNWAEVISGLQALTSTRDGRRTVLVAPAGVDTGPFRTWAAESSGDLSETVFTAIDFNARMASHLLAYFPGDRLIDAMEVEALVRDFFTRPPGSYAIVIAVDHLTSEEEAGLLEQTAWRLLVQHPPSNWRLADLQQYGVWSWSASEPAFMAARVQKDREALAAWLRDPGADLDALGRRQIGGLLRQAEEMHRRQRTVFFTQQASRTRDLAAAIDGLSEFRTRLSRRLEADGESLVAEVTAAMRDWHGPLKESMNRELLSSSDAHLLIRPEKAQEIVKNRLRQAGPEWGEKIAALIRNHRSELQRDSETLFDVVDWTLVNEAAAASAAPAQYPEALFARVFENSDRFDNRPPGTGSIGVPERKEGLLRRNLVVLGFPVTVGVSVALWLVSFPLSFPIGMIAGLVSSVTATHNAKGECDYGQCALFASEAAHLFLQRSISHFQSEVRVMAARLVQRWEAELRKLENLIDRVMQENQNSARSSDDGRIADQLDGLRVRIEGLGRTASRASA
jgi:hypothetical protein